MFDFVHENKRIVQVIFALMILPFALWGVASYDKSGSGSEGVASVNGSPISQQDFDNSLRTQQERLRKQMGANFDPAMLDNPEIKQAVLENLVKQHLLLDRAKSVKLVVTDERIAQVISSIEAFQNNGKFDKSRYIDVLKSQNMTPLIFEARLREEFLAQQMQDAYAQNGFSSNTITDNMIHLNEQQRLISLAPITFSAFTEQVKVDDADVKKYYEQNPKEFQVPEQAKVEYVKFSVDNLLAKIEINQDDAKKYYDEHVAEFGTAEERQASHILIPIAASASQAEQDAAKVKAANLLQQAKQNPAKFPELAKLNSQDPGSASKGGDLGYFGHGMMVKPFDDAVFAMKSGEISELVRSDFGYHIIKLTAIKPSRTLPFEEAREGITTKLRQQQASDKFAALAEKFSNSVYEQSDTLKAAADLVGAKVEQSDWLNKGAVLSAPWTPKMLDAIFSDDVTKRKRNTPAIEVDLNTLVAARLIELKPVSVSTFAEVQNKIREKLRHSQALLMAENQGKSMLAQLKKGEKPVLTWGSSQSVTRSKHDTLDAELVRQVFQINPGQLPQYVGTEVKDSGYLIVRLESIKEGNPITDASRSRYAQQLRKLTGEEMFRAYLEDAKQQVTIKVSLPTQPQP